MARISINGTDLELSDAASRSLMDALRSLISRSADMALIEAPTSRDASDPFADIMGGNEEADRAEQARADAHSKDGLTLSKALAALRGLPVDREAPGYWRDQMDFAQQRRDGRMSDDR